jgi:hypothetical protein
MHNFNHERLGIVMQANRLARVCIEEALRVSCIDAHIKWDYRSNILGVL